VSRTKPGERFQEESTGGMERGVPVVILAGDGGILLVSWCAAAGCLPLSPALNWHRDDHR